MRSPNVYKIVVSMLYGNYTWMSRQGNGIVEVRTNEMRKMLNVRVGVLRSYLRTLEQLNFISGLEFGFGYARFTITKPTKYLDDIGYVD